MTQALGAEMRSSAKPRPSLWTASQRRWLQANEDEPRVEIQSDRERPERMWARPARHLMCSPGKGTRMQHMRRVHMAVAAIACERRRLTDRPQTSAQG